MSLLPPPKVGKLQEALHAKAKKAPTYRFDALYDKVYRGDVLWHAYHCCRLNAGAAGVDGQTFADIEAYGVGKWLGELAEELRRKTYRPQAVRRVFIPKPDGKQRPLGIPMVRAYCTPYQEPWDGALAGVARCHRRWPLAGRRDCRQPAYLATVTSTTGSASDAAPASAIAR
ncbi:MAG TPA: hypothetical protein VG013_11155 [Gemmataceae bacterium]|jgi:hypothetical protein|nr:hypothetical protein [Gemmataceae bacterium]